MGEGPDNVVPFPARPSDAPPELGPILEALLFAAGEPVTVRELATAIGEVDPAQVRDALHELAQETLGRGIRLVQVAKGWQLRTDPRFAEAVLRLRGGRPQKMSKAALEALAVVAYRQPCTRSEVDAVRGVKSGGVLKTLLDKGYLRVLGRRDEPGRPLEYGTTPLFLEMFSLPDLSALPTLKEREELAAQEAPEDDDDEGGGEDGARLEVPADEAATAGREPSLQAVEESTGEEAPAPSGPDAPATPTEPPSSPPDGAEDDLPPEPGDDPAP